MTKVALLTYHDNIQQANPGFQRDKFVYRLNRTEYEKNWHEHYDKPGFGSHLLAILITILPKVGPLKDLKLSLPNADQQTIYIKSVNETVDRLNTRLDKIRDTTTAAPIPVVAQSNGKQPDAGTAPAADATVQQAANSAGEVQGAGAITSAAQAPTVTPKTPEVTEATSVKAAQALPESAVAQPMGETPLKLTSIDLDTGKATSPGEYGLADKTYALLLERIATEPPTEANAGARNDVLLYFGPDQAEKNRLATNPKQWAKVQAALSKLQPTAGDPTAPKSTGLQ